VPWRSDSSIGNQRLYSLHLFSLKPTCGCSQPKVNSTWDRGRLARFYAAEPVAVPGSSPLGASIIENKIGFAIILNSEVSKIYLWPANSKWSRNGRMNLAWPFNARTGISTLASGAGGAAGAIARGGAPQRGAQPREYEASNQTSPGRHARKAKEKRQRRAPYQPGAKRQELGIYKMPRAESPPYTFMDRAFSPPCSFMRPVLALCTRLV
jgi:hypothetical protein